jgi:hypothetical protein
VGKKLLVTLVLLAGAVSGAALAQENFTNGPVWSCAAYRTTPGQADDYMRYLRENLVPTTADAKAQGLILDRKVFTKAPTAPDDWDVMICSLYPSYGKALDYDADVDAKMKAIQAKHYKTPDEKQQEAMSAKRLDMRTFLWVRNFREINLRPM